MRGRRAGTSHYRRPQARAGGHLCRCIGAQRAGIQACISKTVASSDQADAHLTELLAISEAAKWPWDSSCMAMDQAGSPISASSVRIFSDSQSAPLSVESWIPSHSGLEGNEKANKLAKAATRAGSEEPPQRDGLPWYLVTQALKRAEITTGPLPSGRADTGKLTKKIDATLHLDKATGLYQQLSSSEAAILAQLRTGK